MQLTEEERKERAYARERERVGGDAVKEALDCLCDIYFRCGSYSKPTMG